MSAKSTMQGQVDRLKGVILHQQRRLALMANTALSFRQVVQMFGRHKPDCAKEDGKPCPCGWERVETFMADDGNFAITTKERDRMVGKKIAVAT